MHRRSGHGAGVTRTGAAPKLGPPVLLETTDLPVSHVAFAAGFRQEVAPVPRHRAYWVPPTRRADCVRAISHGAGAGATSRRAGRTRHPAPPSLQAALRTPAVGTRLPPASTRYQASRRSTAPPSTHRPRLPHGPAARDLRPQEAEGDDGPPTWRVSSSSRTYATCRRRWLRSSQLLDLDADPDRHLGGAPADPLLGALSTIKCRTTRARRRRRLRARRFFPHGGGTGLGPRRTRSGRQGSCWPPAS